MTGEATTTCPNETLLKTKARKPPVPKQQVNEQALGTGAAVYQNRDYEVRDQA